MSMIHCSLINLVALYLIIVEEKELVQNNTVDPGTLKATLEYLDYLDAIPDEYDNNGEIRINRTAFDGIPIGKGNLSTHSPPFLGSNLVFTLENSVELKKEINKKVFYATVEVFVEIQDGSMNLLTHLGACNIKHNQIILELSFISGYWKDCKYQKNEGLQISFETIDETFDGARLIIVRREISLDDPTNSVTFSSEKWISNTIKPKFPSFQDTFDGFYEIINMNKLGYLTRLRNSKDSVTLDFAEIHDRETPNQCIFCDNFDECEFRSIFFVTKEEAIGINELDPYICYFNTDEKYILLNHTIVTTHPFVLMELAVDSLDTRKYIAKKKIHFYNSETGIKYLSNGIGVFLSKKNYKHPNIVIPIIYVIQRQNEFKIYCYSLYDSYKCEFDKKQTLNSNSSKYNNSISDVKILPLLLIKLHEYNNRNALSQLIRLNLSRTDLIEKNDKEVDMSNFEYSEETLFQYIPDGSASSNLLHLRVLRWSKAQILHYTLIGLSGIIYGSGIVIILINSVKFRRKAPNRNSPVND